jgi:hypothetical protein
VVSSFGKRKYTKGYYFNFRSHKKLELPVIIAKKASGVSALKIAQENLAPVNDKVSVFTSPANSNNRVKEKKINLLHISQYITGKALYTLPQNNSQNISEYSKSITDYGVPGHGNVTDDTSRDKYDGVATVGFVLAIVSIVFLAAGGFGILLIVPAFICSIIGLKSKRRHGQATAGLVISTIEIVLVILIIILLIEVLGEGRI